jgi:Protein of unknown function (DUF2721)
MELTVTTPALLFPAISLLLLAYTNRFLHLAQLARGLYDKYRETKDESLHEQLINLRYRLRLIRNTQFFGVAAFFACVLSMFLLFTGQLLAGQVLFGLSLVSLLISLAISLREVQVSIDAIEIQLSGMDRL